MRALGQVAGYDDNRIYQALAERIQETATEQGYNDADVEDSLRIIKEVVGRQALQDNGRLSYFILMYSLNAEYVVP